MTDLSGLLVDLRRRWLAAGISPRTGVTRAQVDTFEQRYGVRMPQAMAAYFQATDGMNDDQMDDLMIRFWPLSEVRPATVALTAVDQDAYRDQYVFADWSMWAHGYAVHVPRAGYRAEEVTLVGGRIPIPIAASFGAFLRTYLADSRRLFPPRSA